MLSVPLASLKSTPHTGKANQSISSNAAVRLDYFACHCKNFCLSAPSRLFSSPAKLKLKLVHNHLKPHFSSCSMYVQDLMIIIHASGENRKWIMYQNRLHFFCFNIQVYTVYQKDINAAKNMYEHTNIAVLSCPMSWHRPW